MLKTIFLLTGFIISGFVLGQNDTLAPKIPVKLKNVEWLFPETPYTGSLYNRIEIGVPLPNEIQRQVNYFIETDDSTKGINPFLEWQLDITATFTHLETGSSYQTDAFYYEAFSRDTSNTDFRKWHWNHETTPYPMRVRFAPPHIGKWACAINIKTREKEFSVDDSYFQVNPSDNKGFITVGESKRFFTLGDETFFPSGQNLVSPRCEFCFANTAMGLPGPRNGTAKQSLESWMLRPTIVKGFVMFEEHIKSLGENGGNYFRELLIPQNQGIEWEKLGNYHGRLNRAWELDRHLFLAEELDLRMQLNLQIQYALEVNPLRSYWNWSVDPQDKRHRSEETPLANPYNTQIKTTRNDNPDTFFSDPTARKFYKQKLRYIVSRWGYSTHMTTFEMASEIETSCGDSPVCVDWMTDMADYLTKELKINQILAPSFLGIYHDAENYEYPITALPEYEFSTFNWYSVSPAKYESIYGVIDDFTTRFDQPFYFGEIGNSDLYPCDTARIEWVRDSWMTAFSGNAGVGMNWDEPFDDELRQHLGNIKTFTEGIDFDNNGNPWTPIRVISDNRKAEIMILMSPDSTKAIGVLSNRYYNWYMYGDTNVVKNDEFLCKNRVPTDIGFDPNRPAGEQGVWERTYDERPYNYIDRLNSGSEMNDSKVYAPFQSFDFNEDRGNRIRLYNLIRGAYITDFYSALTMEKLDTRTNWGPNVQLEYPEMTEENGLIAFKIYLKKNGGF